MLFTITGKHIEITEAMREHAEQKTAKFPKYYNSISRVEVIIDGSDGGNISVEIIAKGEHSNIFIVTEAGDDAYQCIDLAARKLERQIKRKKTKERDNKHAGASEKTQAPPPPQKNEQ
ncbi:ribosome hibernation-promoting factor, HPF/YfiA family [Planctomycetota bacterium]